ncbi:MAG: TIGR04255 family protein [Dehalococcoidia bacterium]|nr:TIGR04255 family protein [Dehalococcoidia bacterium]
MSRKYGNPPITEAVCEFRFAPSTPWDLTIPGLVYEEVRGTFPKKRQATTLEARMSAGPEGLEHHIATTPGMQFVREDEKALLQVGKDLLSAHHLKPYPTWQEFLPLVRHGFDAYCKVARPQGVGRIGLRYINRVEIKAERVKMEDYFEFHPTVGPQLPQNLDEFSITIQIPFENGRDRTRLQLGSVKGEPNTVTAILDIDYSLARSDQVSLDTVFEWVEVAHSHVEDVFEGCITDKLRAVFEEE